MVDLEKLMKESGHEWQLDKKGLPDDYAYELYPDENSFAGHNGYRCLKCGYIFCVHCIEAQSETFESECRC